MDWRRLASYDVLALTSAVWFLAKFLRYAFPPLFGTFQVEYGASTALLGTIFSVMMAFYAVMQFPAGAIGDRVGEATVIAAGAAVAATGAALLWLTPTFALLVVGMALVGIGTGLHKTVSINLLSQTYPARTGRALGAFDAVGALGGVAAPAAVVALLAGPGWRPLFAIAGTVGLVLAVAVARRVEDGSGDGPDDQSDGGLRRYGRSFADWRFVAFVAVTIAFSFAYNGLVAFLPLYLETDLGLPAEQAGLLYAALFVASLVQPVTGDLSDRLGELPVVAGTLTLALAASAALLVVAGPLAAGAVIVLLGLGSHGFRPVRDAYLMVLIPEDVAGGTLGVVRTLLMGAGAVAPAAVGILGDVASLRAGFALLAGALAVAVTLTAGLWATA